MGRKAELEFILECISEINRLRLINPNLAERAARALKEVIAKWTKIDIIRSQTNNLNNNSQQVDKPKEELLIYDLISKVFEPYTMFIDTDMPVNKIKPVDNIDFLELSKNPLWEDIAISTSSNYNDAINKLKDIKENISSDDTTCVRSGIDELKKFYQEFMNNINNYYLDQQVYLMYLVSKIQYLIEKRLFDENKDYQKINKGILAGLYEDIANLLITDKYPLLAYEISNKYGYDIKALLRVTTSILKTKPVSIAPIDFNLILPQDKTKLLSYLNKLKIYSLQRRQGSKDSPKIYYDDPNSSIRLEYVMPNGNFISIVESFFIAQSEYLMDFKNKGRNFTLGEDVGCDAKDIESINIGTIGIKFYYRKEGNKLLPVIANERKIKFNILEYIGKNVRGPLCQAFVARYDSNGVLTISQYDDNFYHKGINSGMNYMEETNFNSQYQFFVCNSKLFFKYTTGNKAVVVKRKGIEQGYSSETFYYLNGELVGYRDDGIIKELMDNIDNVFQFPNVESKKNIRVLDDKDIILQLINDIFPIEFAGRLKLINYTGEQTCYQDNLTYEQHYYEQCRIFESNEGNKISLLNYRISTFFTEYDLVNNDERWQWWLNRSSVEYEAEKSIS